MQNEMTISFLSVSENEAFARTTVAAFISQLDPTLDEITEIKTVVSEAVTNAIIHGYNNERSGYITIHCLLYNRDQLEITIEDEGVGISNINKAKEALYTSRPELERSGMGFTIMESFMDHMIVDSVVNVGTSVKLKKQLTSIQTVCH